MGDFDPISRIGPDLTNISARGKTMSRIDLHTTATTLESCTYGIAARYLASKNEKWLVQNKSSQIGKPNDDKILHHSDLTCSYSQLFFVSRNIG